MPCGTVATQPTKALISNDPNDKSLFERKLKEYDILYHRIRIATPRHNGKVERQHRIDQQRFYNRLRMFSLEDGRKQLAVYQYRYTASQRQGGTPAPH